MPHLIDEDRAFFKTNGYLIKHDLLTQDQLETALTVVWENLDCDRDDPDSWTKPGLSSPRIASHPAIRSTLHDSPAFAIAEELTGKSTLNEGANPGPQFRFPAEDKTWERSSRGHLDGYYTPTNGVAEGTVGRFSVGVTLYLNHVRSQSGGFTLWPGTHIQAAEHFKTHSLLCFKGGNANETFDMPDPVEVTGPPGTACFWHGQLMHTGSKNAGTEIRMALISRLRRKDQFDTMFEFPDDIWAYYDGIN